MQLDRSSVPIAMGEPVGGGMFVSNVVLAAAILRSPQGFVDIEHKAFMRDCSFYTGGVVLLAIVAWDAKARTHLASHVRGCVCILAHRMQAWHRYIKFALEV